MENLGVLSSESIFLGLASLGEAGQGISSSISLSLAVVDSEVVPRELLGPTDLSRTQVHALAKVVVISDDKNLVLATFQVVAPILEGVNNSQ